MKSIWNLHRRFLAGLVVAAFMVALLAPCMASATDNCCMTDAPSVSLDANSASKSAPSGDLADTDHCAQHCGFQATFTNAKAYLVDYQSLVIFPVHEIAAPRDYLSGLFRPPQA